MQKTLLTCDGCLEPIEARNGYPRNEFISVSLQDIPMEQTEGRATFLVAMKSKLDREYHFHSLKCLSNWDKFAPYEN